MEETPDLGFIEPAAGWSSASVLWRSNRDMGFLHRDSDATMDLMKATSEDLCPVGLPEVIDSSYLKGHGSCQVVAKQGA